MSDMQIINEQVTALRAEFEKKAPNFEAIFKLEEKLNAQEVKSQEQFKSLSESKKVQQEMESKFSELEADLRRPNLSGSEKEAKSLELKAYANFFTRGEVEKKYLRSDLGTDGGYLVPVEQSSEIIKKITEISDVRSLAKVRTLNAKTLRLPTRSSLITSGWAGEGETGLTSHSSYGREELVAKKLSVSSALTIEELQDATPSIIAEINSDVAEEFALREGVAFVNGNSPKQPEGFMVNADIGFIVTGLAAALSFDSLIALTGEIKRGYNPVYAFNRKTLANIRTLKDTSGRYIWEAGNLGAGLPNQINGHGYAVLNDMPDIGAGLYPVIFGDFFKGYLIGDRAGMTMIRDEVTLKKEGKVEFTFMKRLDAAVVLPEAFKKLKCSV